MSYTKNSYMQLTPNKYVANWYHDYDYNLPIQKGKNTEISGYRHFLLIIIVGNTVADVAFLKIGK